jgi:cytochrome b involved in lipid metabolism
MNRNLTVILVIIGILVLGLAAWGYWNWRVYAPTSPVVQQQDAVQIPSLETDVAATSTPRSGQFSQIKVAQHADATSCYTVINGNVYDLTAWIGAHPGGPSAILSLCGTDGTEKFMAQHKGAQKQMDILAGFYIGTLSN